ncbi:TPA: hypothetical protein PTV43_001681 [Clostridium botulinum]|nr:hypothetical protein [Clostridium botulinum]
MNGLILTCNIAIPVLMIFIGISYKHNLCKRTYKILDLIMSLIIPIIMFFIGFSYGEEKSLYENTNELVSINRKSSLVWSISGAVTLLFTITLLILNKFNIYNASVILLETECLILVTVLVTAEYILKRNSYKRIYEQY